MTAFYLSCGFVFGAFFTGAVTLITFPKDTELAYWWTVFVIITGILSFTMVVGAIWQESKNWNDPIRQIDGTLWRINRKWRGKKNDKTKKSRNNLGHERTGET